MAYGIERIESALPRLYNLAQGGTAVGTVRGYVRHRPQAYIERVLYTSHTIFIGCCCYFKGYKYIQGI